MKRFCLLGRRQRERRWLRTVVAADVGGIARPGPPARPPGAAPRTGSLAAAPFTATAAFAAAALAGSAATASTLRRLCQQPDCVRLETTRAKAPTSMSQSARARRVRSCHHRSHLVAVADCRPAPECRSTSRIAVDYAADADHATHGPRQPGSRFLVPRSRRSVQEIDRRTLFRPYSQIGPQLLVVELRLGLRFARQKRCNRIRRGN